MNGRTLLRSTVLAAAAMTALPAVAGADDFWFAGSVGSRPSYTPYTPVVQTTSRVIRYGQLPIYVDYNRVYDRPVVTRTVTYVTPSEPTYIYPAQRRITRVVSVETPVYLDRGVSYRRGGYPVYRQRRIYTHLRPHYRPSYRFVDRYRNRSHGRGFSVGIHTGRSGHRGGGFGVHFNRYR